MLDIKSMSLYNFECNINAEEVKEAIYFHIEEDWTEDFEDGGEEYSCMEEWGLAYVELGNISVEYNLSLERIGDEIVNSSAIYKTEIRFDENEGRDVLETDYNKFVPYEIDFNDADWKEKLEDAMCKALVEFFNL